MPSIRATEKKIMIFKEKLNSIDSLVQCVKSFAEGYTQETISRVSKNVVKRATVFSTFCRTPVVVPFVLRLIYVKKNLNFPLLPSKLYKRLFIFANVKYFYERFKIFI